MNGRKSMLDFWKHNALHFPKPRNFPRCCCWKMRSASHLILFKKKLRPPNSLRTSSHSCRTLFTPHRHPSDIHILQCREGISWLGQKWVLFTFACTELCCFVCYSCWTCFFRSVMATRLVGNKEKIQCLAFSHNGLQIGELSSYCSRQIP